MQRIKFGSETKLQIIAARCPGCGASQGTFHEYGCLLETCPKCGGRLLHCTCKALDLADALNLVGAISTSIDRAVAHRALGAGSKHLSQTYHEEGVMSWIIRDVTARDPESAKQADKLIEDMELKKVENGYAISAETAADLMGVPVEEARQILQKMETDASFPGWEEKTFGQIQ